MIVDRQLRDQTRKEQRSGAELGQSRTDPLTEEHRQKRSDQAGDPDREVEDDRVMLERRPARLRLLRHLCHVFWRRHRIVRIHPAIDREIREHDHGGGAEPVHELALVALQETGHEEQQSARHCERMQLDADDQREHAADQPADAPATFPGEDACERTPRRTRA